MKKAIGIGLLLVTIASWVIGLLWWNWVYPKNYECALRLADDSSLPEQKAEYLKEYFENVKGISGSVAYLLQRPDFNLEKQRDILKGLIRRFEDIAKIKPSEMAYQQGMEQLTGQEINHQLARISSLFRAAKLRENPGLFFFIATCSWIFLIPVAFLMFSND